MTRKQHLIVMKIAGLLSLLDQGIVPSNLRNQAHELLDEIGEHFGDEMQALADGADDRPEDLDHAKVAAGDLDCGRE